MKRKTLAVAGAAAVATVMIGGAALAAAGDDDAARGRPAAATVTGSPSPTDTPTDTPTGSPTDTPTGTASPEDPPTDSPTGSPDDSPTTTAPAPPNGANVSGDLAAAAALARVGGGTVTSVESESEHGRAVWKVRIVRNGVRYDVHVDKETGAITRFRNKGSDNSGSDH